MNNENRGLVISMLDSEMNRFWTRFNIFSAIQIVAVIGVVTNIKLLMLNINIFRGVLSLLVMFSISGIVSILRGLDLQRAFVNTLEEVERKLPKGDRLLLIAKKHMRLPLYISNVTAVLFTGLVYVFWILGWIYLEVAEFAINFPIGAK